MNEKRLFLLDAYALIFRAYYALIKVPRLTRDGFNTSAIFGFVNTLEELFKKENPSHLAVCFDPPGPTFRHEADENYKSERAATPEDIKQSVPVIKEILKAYNVPVVEIDGYEADDVIGTLARKAEKEGFTVYMMTPDKDFGQLVSPNILQYKPSYRGQDFELRGEREVCARYGIRSTSQVIDLLALMGDKIDNIPGCPGVGEKTAVKLIQDYGSVDNLLLHKDDLKGALKKKIEDNSEQILFSKYLATIKTDVPVDTDPMSFTVKKPDTEKLFAIFKELEFKTLSERVKKRLDSTNRQETRPSDFPASLFDLPESHSDSPVKKVAGNADYSFIDNSGKLTAFSEKYNDKDICGIFFVSEGENDMTARWIGTAVSFTEGEAAFIPSDFDEGRAWILDLEARGDICKVSVNSKRDMVISHNARHDSADPLENYFDVTLAQYLIQAETGHSLESMAFSYLNYETMPLPSAPNGKKGSKTEPLKGLTPRDLCDWACERADITLRLREPLEKEVTALGMKSLLDDLELPLVRVLAEMEIAGVRIDVNALNDAADIMEEKLKGIEKEIFILAGEEFNVGSPSKVGEVLFDKLKLDEKAKKTKTGQYSTSEDILEKIAHKNPVVGKILEYRQMKKLLTTYLTALPASINPATGKVHTVYNQTVTATGRLSSTCPNLQNIPIREGEGRYIRKAFIPDPGHIFLSADYSQIELRLVADFANEETMLKAFRDGVDIHAITASKIYDRPVEDVTADERRHAKTANFGILYGISAFGLASRLGIPRGQAKEIIDNYFDRFPTIHKYISDSVEKARENGYVETITGRRRQLPDINSRNPVVRGYAERNAVNSPIQGSAADIIKRAMVAIASEMREKKLKSRMIMQVHDELNFDVVPEELPVMQELVERLMENAYQGQVRLTASCGVGSNWLEAH